MNESLPQKFAELADLLAKLETLRLLYKHIKQHQDWCDHPNHGQWMTSINRAASVLQRRIHMTEGAILLNVGMGEPHVNL